MFRMSIAPSLLATALFASCAAQQGQPLSADEHLAQAEHHERKAEEHEGKHHVDWTPTPGWEQEAARYREIAAKHRAASAALKTSSFFGKCQTGGVLRSLAKIARYWVLLGK